MPPTCSRRAEEHQRDRPTTAYAAIVPSDTSVSIVVAPWRRFTSVARWNGHADQRITGVDEHERDPLPAVELQRRAPSRSASTRDRRARPRPRAAARRSRSSSASGSSGSVVGHRVAEVGDRGGEGVGTGDRGVVDDGRPVGGEVDRGARRRRASPPRPVSIRAAHDAHVMPAIGRSQRSSVGRCVSVVMRGQYTPLGYLRAYGDPGRRHGGPGLHASRRTTTASGCAASRGRSAACSG